MRVHPYLSFNGQCEEAFRFYEKTLGGKIQEFFRYEGSPMAKDAPAEWGKKIMHVTMIVGDDIVSGADAPPGYFSKTEGMSLTIALKDPAEGERIFNVLAEGGTVKMKFGATFWSKGFGMVIDRWGIPWMINCD
jgi:PhnB protein